MRLRDARPDDCLALSALAFASKAHWGYDEAFMDACRAELTVRPGDLARVRVRVAEERGLCGFHGVERDDLLWFFVAPDEMGRGIGRTLFADACAVARDNGVMTLRIEADPHAAAFYERMGAVRAGDVPSGSVAGRRLPLYTINLS